MPKATRQALPLLLLIAILACLPAVRAAEPPAVDMGAQYAARICGDLREQAGLPGMAACVMRHGEILWRDGFGYASLELRAPVRNDTRFRIASISKPIATVVGARLSERGDFDFDKPVRHYLDELTEDFDKVASRQLVGHLGGIRHYLPGENDKLYGEHFDTARSSLPKFVNNQPFAGAPGEKFIYTTYGFTLYAAAVEAAANASFPELLKREVTRPLGMVDTNTVDPRIPTPGRTAFYERIGDGTMRNAEYADLSYKYAGGGILSTPTDLCRFGSALLKPGFLKQETMDMLFTSQVEAGGRETGYGMGFGLGEMELLGRTIHHSGGQLGAASMLRILPESGLVVSAAANVGGPEIASGLSEALALCFADGMRPLNDDELDAREGLYRITAKHGELPFTGDLLLRRDELALRGEMVLPRDGAGDSPQQGPDALRASVITSFEFNDRWVLILHTIDRRIAVAAFQPDGGAWTATVDGAQVRMERAGR